MKISIIRTRMAAIAAAVLLAACAAQAQQFQTESLKRAAAKLKLRANDFAADSLPATLQLKVGEQAVVARVSDKGVVEHIGIPLFTEELRLLQPSPIYDYLEYTVLDRIYKVSANTLTHQDLKFEKGNLAQLAKVKNETDGCIIDYVSDKYYRVKWVKENAATIVVSFPINYELLANSNRKELELNFIRDIKVFSDTTPIVQIDLSDKMAPTKDPDLFVVQGEHYIIPEINSNRYLTVNSKETDGENEHHLGFVFDRHQPQESLTNLMVEPGMPIDSAMVELEFVLGNLKRDTVCVTLHNWMAFCKKQGCLPYFGFEENKEGTLTGTLVMRNRQSGYDHIVAVRAEESELFARLPRIHATVHLFTPSTNVRNLFGKTTKLNRPRIKYSK